MVARGSGGREELTVVSQVPSIVRTLLPAFQEQGCTEVAVAQCCGRLFVGRKAPTVCRTCPNVPVARIVRADGTDLDNLDL